MPGIDKDELEKKLNDEKWRRRMQDLREAAMEQGQQKIIAKEAYYEECCEELHQALRELEKEYEKELDRYGSESVETLLLRMLPTLKATWKAEKQFIGMVLSGMDLGFCKVRVGLGLGECVAQIRNHADYYLDTEGHYSEGLGPVVIPFLAEVDENGVLTVNLNSTMPRLSEEDRKEFVNKHEPEFKDNIYSWINGMKDTNGKLKYRIEEMPNGDKKIAKLSATTGDPIGYMNAHEFRELRQRALVPALENLYQMTFAPESKNNLTPGV